jgi:centromeric protein E
LEQTTLPVWFNMQWNMVRLFTIILVVLHTLIITVSTVHLRVKASTDTEYLIKLTYAELYNEEIKDLLSPTPNENLKIIEDPNVGPLIHNITEAIFTSAADVKVLLEEGENRRHFGVTNMNAHSSRSHVIVRLHIESRKVGFKVTNAIRSSWGKDRPNCVSTLNLVDLAGSERANKAGTSGQSLKEGSFINKSLLTLGTVIANLSEGKTQHIPYRNSKLTRLLATALGGNAKTSVITCISPASGNVAESLNTLRFASRAKRIVNQVQKNELLDMKSLSSKLTLQMQEIEHLRHQVELSRQLGFSPEDGEAVGESLRDKAVSASKSMRSFKFFVKEGPRIMNALRAQGMSHLAKKVMNEVKLAINGQRDPAAMIEEYSTLIETYLSKDRRLMEKVHNVALQNEAEALISVQDGIPIDEGICDADDDDDEDDMFDTLVAGGDEMKEIVELSNMQSEELRVIASNHIRVLQQELADSLSREKTTRKSLDDSQQRIVEHHESLMLLKNSEAMLHKQIDDIKAQRKHESNLNMEQQKHLNIRVNELQLKLQERIEECTQRNIDLNGKENEIEGLRNQLVQITNDLNSAIASKKAFEEESSRARSEMRIQMDKLRNNMHKMLLQGGMEAKVIESQNNELQKELDRTRESAERFNQEKENLELDLKQLRTALSVVRDSEKAKQDEINALRHEVIAFANCCIVDVCSDRTNYWSACVVLLELGSHTKNARLTDGI